VALTCGVRYPPYIDGILFDTGVSSYAPGVDDAKYQQRFSDGTLFTSFAQPFTNCPRKTTKMQFSVRFDKPSATDKEQLLMVTAYAGSFDFCPWLPLGEQWYNNATPTAQRRNALTVITAGGDRPGGNPTVEFAAKTVISGADQTVTWGSVDSTNYRHPFTTSGVTTGDIYLIYFPVFRVVVAGHQVDYSLPNREAWTLALMER